MRSRVNVVAVAEVADLAGERDQTAALPRSTTRGYNYLIKSAPPRRVLSEGQMRDHAFLSFRASSAKIDIT